MKKTFRKIAFCTLALLALGGIRMSAATETYDFTTIEVAETDIVSSRYVLFTWGDNVADDMQMMAYGTQTFNNRFSAGPRAQNAGANANCFKLRVDAGDWKGLYSQYADRCFAIRDLKVGDKVTITMKAGRENLNFKTGTTEGQSYATVEGVTGEAAVANGTTYTVTTNGILLFTTTGETIIQKIEIETPSVSVPVTINIISNASAEEYDFQKLGQAQASEGTTDVTFSTEVLTSPASIKLISFGNETFNNRFAGNRDWAIRKHSNAAYCGLYNKNGYSGRYLAICNLKVGDKVSIKFICDSEQSLIFENAIVEGVSANDEVVSEQVYVVKTAGELVLNESANTANKRVYIYKVTIESAEVLEGDYIGTTLVSDKALDFSEVKGITAYVATKASSGTVTFSPVTKVAANTPLYIKANETSGAVLKVDVPEAESGAVDYSSTNLLKGKANSKTELKSTDDTKYYVFGVLKNKAGFYPVGTLTSAAGKAYLELTSEQAAAAANIAIRFEDDSETTGISTAATKSATEDNVWYTLQGVRVTKPTHGIYVRNGKKVFIK